MCKWAYGNDDPPRKYKDLSSVFSYAGNCAENEYCLAGWIKI